MTVVVGGDVVTYLCRPPLSPVPVSSPAWNRQILPHLSSQCSCLSVCNTLTCMRTYINIYCIYTVYVHTVHKWVANMDLLSMLLHRQCAAGLLNGPWINIWQLTWQTWSFSPPFHFCHTPRGTNSHFGFCFHLGTWKHSEGRGEFVTLQCADWTQRKLSGENDSWKLGLQWKPFWPCLVRPTDYCGWWLGGK